MRTFRIASLLLLALAIPTAARAEFYTDLLDKGKAYYHVGRYAQAEKALRLASFGFLDRIDLYETAKIYLALSYDRLDSEERARETMIAFFRAEKIRPTYRTLAIPGDVKSAFEQAVARVYPEGVLSIEQPRDPGTQQGPRTRSEPVPVPQRGAESPPPPVAPPVTTTPIEEPAAEASGTSVEVAELQALRAQQPDSVPITLALADALLRDGDLTEARRWATEVADQQPQNAIAKIYLARISHREANWAEAANHYLAADRLVTLTQDDRASLLTALVAIGRWADARKVATTLNDRTLRREDVASAIAALAENFRPIPPAVATKSPPDTPEPTVVVAQRTDEPDESAETEPTAVPAAREDLFALMREARSFESSARCDEAIRIYEMVLRAASLERFVILAAAHGLSNCGNYDASVAAYAKADPLGPGEETHMFRMAVNLFETGNLQAAREYMRRALVRLEVTREVREYRSKIGE